MKRLLVTAAVLPLAYAAAHAETKISTETTTPVATSTVAAGAPDSIRIEAAGSVKPTGSGSAVTMDAPGLGVTNLGAINFNNVSNATGIALVGSGGGAVATNSGVISLLEDYTPTDADNDGDFDGAFAQGTGRFGIRLTGAGAFSGSVINGGTITVEGLDSAGVSLETRLEGSLINSGTVSVVGERVRGISAVSVAGDVRITGAVAVQGEGAVGVQLGDVDGGVVLQNAISATGYRTTERLADAVRAKFDADELKQSGSAVRITGNVVGGVLLDRPPSDADANNADEDADGVADASEGTASLVSYSAAPGLDIGGAAATSLGAIGTGSLAFGLVNKGAITGSGVNDGVSSTGLRIGQAGGGLTTVAGGINNLAGTISATSFGSIATGLLLSDSAVVPLLRNSGTIRAIQSGGAHDARAIVDLSGRLTLIENSGTITTSLSGTTVTARAIAIDLSANTNGATIRQAKVSTADAPQIVGEVVFGSGADALELLTGTLAGDVTFGAGADAYGIDGGAVHTGRINDSDGQLALNVVSGRLNLTNTDTLSLSSLNLGAAGVVGVTLTTPTAARFAVSGAATVATGAKVEVALGTFVREAQSFQLIRAGSLTAGAASATLAGAPYLFQAALRADAATNTLFVDVRPKTAAEIGLNRSQTQAFSAVFAALDQNDDIEAAVLTPGSRETFVALYDQLLPDHSGGAIMSAAAVSAAVTAAAAQPMEIDDESMTGGWLQELQFQIDRDREDAAGYRSRGFGLAGGLDLLGRRNALGVAGSFVTIDYNDRGAVAGEQVTMNQLGGSGYWRHNAGGLSAYARAGLGFAWFKSDRRASALGVDLKAKAKWTGWTAEASAGASYNADLGVLQVKPAVSLDYLRLSEGSYSEKGGGAGFDLSVAKREGDLATGQAGVTFGAKLGDEVWFAPELTVGYRAKLAGGPGRTTAHFAGGQAFTLDAEDPFQGGVVGRVGVRGGTAKVQYLFDAGGVVDKTYKAYDARIAVRAQF